ncbi:hypothetical protein [Catellatospora sp. NPDC049609]|uniref:hypothetical protein n=1 Tax=Catellatospora sp. NPDC049609 TaxID=3155505 RepID=UPI0034378A57
MIDWLDGVWSRAVAVQVLDGGEDGGDLDRRELLAEVSQPQALARARELMTAGTFTGGICRCLGGMTVVLRDAGGAVLGAASVHGYGTLSWERSRFRDDLEVADPAALHLFLAEQGVPGQLAQFHADLVGLLGLREGTPQFRQAGREGKALAEARRVLAARRVPAVLHGPLSAVSGQQAAELDGARLDAIRALLVADVPDPVARAGVLLEWLGRLPAEAEAFWGEGVLVRRLLADLSGQDLVAAVAGSGSGHVAMGVVHWSRWHGADASLVAAVAPTLRRLFPPPAGRGRRRPARVRP